MKRISKLILSIFVAGVLAFTGIAGVNNASATSLKEGIEAARCEGCPENLFGQDGVFHQITSTILYIVGVIAVIMLIWGGLRYVLSGGDAKKVTDAKNTVLYAIIGLIVSFLAYAIVVFVIDALPSSQPETTPESNAEPTSLVIDSTNC